MAGKKASKLKHAKKMAQKRSQKEAKKLRYAALAGSSKKTKKILARARRLRAFNPEKGRHLMAFCGNVGCRKCSPLYKGRHKTA